MNDFKDLFERIKEAPCAPDELRKSKNWAEGVQALCINGVGKSNFLRPPFFGLIIAKIEFWGGLLGCQVYTYVEQAISVQKMEVLKRIDLPTPLVHSAWTPSAQFSDFLSSRKVDGIILEQASFILHFVICEEPSY